MVDQGVASANKFLQKIWNLNFVIIKRKETNFNEKLEKKFNQTINKLVSKIDNSISSFRFNVTIAHFYELYNFFKDNLDKEISNKVLKDSIMKIMKLRSFCSSSCA